jgi:hypothetical protein
VADGNVVGAGGNGTTPGANGAVASANGATASGRTVVAGGKGVTPEGSGAVAGASGATACGNGAVACGILGKNAGARNDARRFAHWQCALPALRKRANATMPTTIAGKLKRTAKFFIVPKQF